MPSRPEPCFSLGLAAEASCGSRMKPEVELGHRERGAAQDSPFCGGAGVSPPALLGK